MQHSTGSVVALTEAPESPPKTTCLKEDPEHNEPTPGAPADGVEKPPPKKTLPKVMGWALAELTQEETQQQQLEVNAILARVHAETAAEIAAEEAEVHETCPTCNHTKTYTKVAGSAELIPKADDPKETRASGMKSARRPLGFTPAKRGKA